MLNYVCRSYVSDVIFRKIVYLENSPVDCISSHSYFYQLSVPSFFSFVLIVEFPTGAWEFFFFFFFCKAAYAIITQYSQGFGSRTHCKCQNPWILKSRNQHSISVGYASTGMEGRLYCSFKSHGNSVSDSYVSFLAYWNLPSFFTILLTLLLVPLHLLDLFLPFFLDYFFYIYQSFLPANSAKFLKSVCVCMCVCVCVCVFRAGMDSRLYLWLE